MSELLYCFPTAFRDPAVLDKPGIRNYSAMTSIFRGTAAPIDRTGVITGPIKTVPLFPLPTFRPFKKTYAQICDERAVQILRDAEHLSIEIYVLYSGGIDSTCLLVSLLKHATQEQKKHIVVLLSHDSITENPRFYEEHIRGKLRTGSSVFFSNYIGRNDMLLSAEHNDMVMGNASLTTLINSHGLGVIHAPYKREMLVELFQNMMRKDAATAQFCFDVLERLCKAAPVPITTTFEFLWWYNIAMKWDWCYYYILFYTPKERADLVTREYLDTRFISFFNTDDFQLWSMNNLDKRIKDTWKSYKWIIKDIIYDYNKDAEYRDHKTKVESLPVVLTHLPRPYKYIDTDARFHEGHLEERHFEANNDYI